MKKVVSFVRAADVLVKGRNIYPTFHQVGSDTRSFYRGEPCTNRDSYAAVTKMPDPVGIPHFGGTSGAKQ